MKKRLIIGQALILLMMSNYAYADTVTGNVYGVSGCNYAENNIVNLINVNGDWYRGQQSGPNASGSRLVLHDWWFFAAGAAMISNRTVTLTYDPIIETLCDKDIVGRFDYSNNGYGEVQINQRLA